MSFSSKLFDLIFNGASWNLSSDTIAMRSEHAVNSSKLDDVSKSWLSNAQQVLVLLLQFSTTKIRLRVLAQAIQHYADHQDD
jgi:hypothetical protein